MRLAQVEEAKALFEEAKGWGVWGWLTEKRRLRHTADAAWEALQAREEKVKQGWDPVTRKMAAHRFRKDDAEAHQARVDAEAQFDEADRRMSTSMARDGAQMAIDAWTMREKLIRRMEQFARKE